MWGRDGGFTATRDRSRLEPCRDFSHTRDPLATDPPTLSCGDPLDDCTGIVTPAQIQAALSHPDVIAAIDAAPVLYGRDTRPVDGQVTQISVDGKLIEIGTPCSGTGTGCVEIPEAVAELRSLLDQLSTQVLAREPCSETF